jgi:exosortase A-associated hydrolase 2
VLDLFGTGDSQGEFREGNWTVWQQDIEQQISVLRAAHDAPVILIGFRLGGLGVIDYLDRHQNTVDQAILIQPVLSGKQYVTQLLRQRMAAQITSGVEKETTSQLRERLDSGENLEIGGYEFGCQLLNDLDNLNVTEKQSVSNVHFSWLEYVASETSDLTLPSKKAIAQFEEQSNRVSVKPFVDHQVWQLHEREEAEASIKVFEDLELGF